jgi:hypothetical protein
MGTSLNGLTPAATYTGLIKFGDNSIIGATLRYLSDGAGNDLPISVSTTKVGIGTTNSTSTLNVASNINLISATTSDMYLNYQSSGNIYYQYSGVTYWQQSVDNADNFRIYSGTKGLHIQRANGYSTFNNGSTTLNSTVGIKGSGSTSATTSLLVQNSAGVNKISCNDDSTTLNLLSGVTGSATAQVTIGAIATGTVYIEANTDGGSNGMRIHTNRQNTPIFFGCTSASTPTNDSITIGNSTTAAGATHNIMFRQSNAVVGGFPNSANATYPSAQFFVESTTRGFLPPRMTTTQKNAIATPSAGLVVYDSTTNKLCCYNGSTWNDLF